MKRILIFVGTLLAIAIVAALHPAAAATSSAPSAIPADTLSALADAAFSSLSPRALGAFAFAGMLLNIGQPLTLDQLAAARTAPTGGYEVYQSSIYDTVTWPIGGIVAGQTLDVFTTTTADETVSNLKQAGQIPKPDKFHSKKVLLSLLIELTADADATAASIVRDVDRMILTSRSVLKLTPSTTGRTRSPIPLDQIGGFGGVIADSGGDPGSGAGLIKAHARLAAIGGHPFDLILDSNEEIRGQFKAGVTQALVAARDVRLALWGWRYQKAG